MGYTHYFSSRAVSERNFKKLTSDMKKVEKFIKTNEIVAEISEDNLPSVVVELYDGFGENKGVQYGKDYFTFNGSEENDLGHENLVIQLGGDGGFCKTARKPYDIVVCLMLISLKYHMKSSVIRSDGKPNEWSQAFTLWGQIFNKRNVMFTFDEKEALKVSNPQQETKKLLQLN